MKYVQTTYMTKVLKYIKNFPTNQLKKKTDQTQIIPLKNGQKLQSYFTEQDITHDKKAHEKLFNINSQQGYIG